MKQRLLQIAASLALLASLGGSLVLLVAKPTLAAGGPREEGMTNVADRRIDGLFSRLALRPEQRALIQAIRSRGRDATKDSRKRLAELRRGLFDLMRRPDGTKEQAFAIQRDIDGIQAQLAQSRLAAWFDARAVLTAEQLSKLSSMGPLGGPRSGPTPGDRHHGPRP